MFIKQLLLKALQHGVLAEVLLRQLTSQTAALGAQLGVFDQLLKRIRKGCGITWWYTAPGLASQQRQFTALR